MRSEMKLNNFYNKPQTRPSRSAKAYVLGNEKKELDLQQQVTNLEDIAGKYREISEAHSKLKGTNQQQEEKIRELSQSNGSLQQQVSKLEFDLAENGPILAQISGLRHDFEAISSAKEEAQSALRLLQEQQNQAQNSLKEAQSKVGTLEIDNKSLFNQLVLAEDTLKELNPALSTLTDEYRQLKDQYEALKEENLGLFSAKERFSEDNIRLLEDTKILQSKLEGSKAVEGQFSNWLDEIKDNYKESIIKKDPNIEKVKAEATIVQMGKDITDWNQFISFLKWNDNKTSKQERFKVPLASDAVNYNTTYLGTGRPTLLKFKREIAHDNETVA